MYLANIYSSRNGNMLESDYGYTGKDGTCKYQASKVKYTPTGAR